MALLDDAALERQAQDLAEKALPASLPPSVRAAKLPAVKQKILERLRLQQASAPPPVTTATAATPSSASGPPPPPPPGAPVGPPTPDERLKQLKVEGAELCGDEPWFADTAVRARMRAAVAEAHKEQKILVGHPRDEIQRICPDASCLAAGAVLRLGGSHLGGYGEADISYAYRQLSRALHPDKNPDLPRASEAFHRLSAAAEELREGLQDQRQMLKLLADSTGQRSSDDLFERPQESLFAEACRLLSAVCGLAGEGDVPTVARSRALAAFSSSFGGCSAQRLLNEWFDRTSLIDAVSSPTMRTCYDCAPKRCRAQFLCLLGRSLEVEAKRSGSGCVREAWSKIAAIFPELPIWRDLRENLRERCWEAEPAVDMSDAGLARLARQRSRSRDRRKRSRWARKWRVAMAAILPSGEDMSVAATDPEVKKLSHVLWKDIAAWAEGLGGGSARALRLFRADHQTSKTFGWEAKESRGLEPGAPPAEWAFIPMSDLLLVVGDGLVGLTAEGVFADNPPGHKRLSLAECYRKKPVAGSENSKVAADNKTEAAAPTSAASEAKAKAPIETTESAVPKEPKAPTLASLLGTAGRN
eukprot:TRINITY_DN19874_c0_g1_i1.p1 TRINITY_DN19874_c0_g1~~TRINITY_DN19874_c0_g1_i1.p1  ORF type:complete len:587 (-),score=158.48 TRINITY_DN19874_c0_g1_i1:137-1897(-)